MHARYVRIDEQVMAAVAAESITTDLLQFTVFNGCMIPDVGFEREYFRRMLDARADALAHALAQGLQHDRIDFASCETTLRAALQRHMSTFVLELKPPGDNRTNLPSSLAAILVNYKATALLLARSVEERKQLLDTGDFVPPVRVAAPLPPRCLARMHARIRATQRARADVAFFAHVLRMCLVPRRILPTLHAWLGCVCRAGGTRQAACRRGSARCCRSWVTTTSH